VQISDDGNAVRDGSDIVFSWVRRTRINGGLVDGFDEVPLSEDSESFDLVIYIGDPLTSEELRVINVSTDSATYTVAQQEADFVALNTWTDITSEVFDNPSFEDGVQEPWVTEDNDDPTIVEDGGFASDGSFFAELNGTEAGAGANSGISNTSSDLRLTIPAWENGLADDAIELRVSLDYQEDSVEPGDPEYDARLLIEFFDADGEQTGTTIEGTQTAITASSWTTVTEVIDAGDIPDDAVAIKVFAACVNSEASIEVVDLAVDNLVLEYRFTGNPRPNIVVFQRSAQVGRGFPSETYTPGDELTA
jgi:hypothetical protein